MICARPTASLALALLLAGLSACGGGMTRTVGVLPNTMDDLGRKSAALRGEPEPPAAEAPRR